MRSLSTISGPVYRIAFGTATLLGIGSLLTLAASLQSSRAVASPGDVGVSYVKNGEATYSMGDLANGYEQAATPAYYSEESALDGGSSIHCCVASGGSCTMVAGSGCPSGSTARSCPCDPEPV